MNRRASRREPHRVLSPREVAITGPHKSRIGTGALVAEVRAPETAGAFGRHRIAH